MGQVLAAQGEHQHSAGVGVADQRSQQLAGLGMVMAGLGAPKGWVKVYRPSMEPVTRS